MEVKTLKSRCYHPRRVINVSREEGLGRNLEASGTGDPERSKDGIDMGDCGSEVGGVGTKGRGNFKEEVMNSVKCS